MKMLEPDIELPWPRPIHCVPDGAMSWKKTVCPLPAAVADGILTWYDSPPVVNAAN
jgi:hypothetical protein